MLFYNSHHKINSKNSQDTFTSTLYMYIYSSIWRISHGHAEIGKERIFFWMLKNISQVSMTNK